MHSLVRAAGAAALVLSSHAALAQDSVPAAPPTEPPADPPAASTTAPTEMAPPSEPDKRERDSTYRDHGFRLGLDLAFNRSLGGGEGRVNTGTPSLIPLGVDISVRLSPGFLFGIHGYAAMASRDDCASADSCRARAYGFGVHIEGTPIRTPKYAGYIRFGSGYEMVYHGGLPADAGGHEYRDGFDAFDLRVGADFIVHRGDDKKTMRIGPYLGAVMGVLANDSGFITSGQHIDNGSPLAVNGWFQIGVRGTLDP